jgi:hypothetical protein
MRTDVASADPGVNSNPPADESVCGIPSANANANLSGIRVTVEPA